MHLLELRHYVGWKDTASSTAWTAAPWEIVPNGSSIAHLPHTRQSRHRPRKVLRSIHAKAGRWPPRKKLGAQQGWEADAPQWATVSAAACRSVRIRSPLNIKAWLLRSSSLMVIILDLVNLLNCEPNWNISTIRVSRAVFHGKKGGKVMFIWLFSPFTSLILVGTYFPASLGLACMWERGKAPPLKLSFFLFCL